MRVRLRDVLALATVAYLLCVSIKTFVPRLFSDIYVVYYVYVLPTNNGIPYHAYSAFSSSPFVYPAIPAIMIWISGLTKSFEFYMATMAFLTFPFVIGAAYFLYRTCVELGIDRGRIIPFFVMAPSFLLISFSSWDIIATSFVIAAIYYAVKKNARLPGLCLGLGFAAKAYPLLLLPVFLREAGTWRGRFEMLLSTVLGGLVPNLPFIVIDFPGWFHTVVFPYRPGGVYLENSIWLVIRYYGWISQDWLMLAVTWSLIILAILHVTFSSKALVLKLWLIEAVTILVFPTYPPQFNVWLLPLFVLNPFFSLIPFLAFDFLDNVVGLSWFTVDNPFRAWGPIWYLFLTRIGLLALLLIWANYRESTIVQRLGTGLGLHFTRTPPRRVRRRAVSRVSKVMDGLC